MVNMDYARLIWVDLVSKLNKKTRERVVPYPRFLSLLLEHKMEGYGNNGVSLNPTQVFSVHNWALKKNQFEGPPFTDHMLAICNDEGPNKLSLDHIIASTNPHVLIEKTKSMSKGLEIVLTQPTIGKGASDIAKKIEEEFNTSFDLSSFEDTQKEIKLKDLSKLVQDAQNHKLEKQKSKAEAKVSFLTAQPSYPNITQFTKLLVTSLKPESSHLLSSYDFGSLLPTELKELPSKFNELTKEFKELKKHVYDLEIELLGDLKEIPTKLETFTSIVKSLTTQVAKLKTLQWELLTKFLSVPTQVESIQAKIKIVDALPSLLKKVTEALNKFSHVIDSTSKNTGDHSVPSAGLAGSHPTGGEEHPIDHNLLGGLIKKDKDKKAMSLKDAEEEGSDSESDDANITGSRVESSKKGPITLKVYREDGIDEANKRLKPSIQYENHPAGTVLNEPVLGMILFNSFNRQDFVTIKDFGDFPNKMLYTVQEIFFRLHQGLGLDDHARNFSSLLLIEVDKKNSTPSSK
nr:hypothetical protein [Tanacetum cinerariifolium]